MGAWTPIASLAASCRIAFSFPCTVAGRMRQRMHDRRKEAWTKQAYGLEKTGCLPKYGVPLAPMTLVCINVTMEASCHPDVNLSVFFSCLTKDRFRDGHTPNCRK
jgi:hypothetical protein